MLKLHINQTFTPVIMLFLQLFVQKNSNYINYYGTQK